MVGDQDIRIRLSILAVGMHDIDKLNDKIDLLSKKYTAAGNRILTMSESVTTQFGDNSGQAKILTQDLREMGILGSESLESIQRQAQATRKNMLFLGLGTLFFGMALQRLFGGIAKTGVDTFRQITEATEGSQSALTGINAGMTFLQFTIGDTINTALEPFLPLILSIIDAFTDFMQQNPWTGWVIIGGVLAGMALLTFGTLTSFMSSIGKTFGGTAGTNILTTIGSIDTSLTNIGKIAATGIGISLLLQGMDEFEKSVVGGIAKAMEGAGMLALAGGKTKAGLIVYTIGAGLQFVETAFQEDVTAALKKLVDAVSTVLIIAGAHMGIAGIPLIVLGFTLMFIEPVSDVVHGVERWISENVLPALGRVIPFLGGGAIQQRGVPYKAEEATDFILQPGGRLIKTDPNDTIMGSKNGFGGMGGNTTINIDARGALFDREGIDKLADVVGNAISSRISNSTSTQTIR